MCQAHQIDVAELAAAEERLEVEDRDGHKDDHCKQPGHPVKAFFMPSNSTQDTLQGIQLVHAHGGILRPLSLLLGDGTPTKGLVLQYGGLRRSCLYGSRR